MYPGISTQARQFESALSKSTNIEAGAISYFYPTLINDMGYTSTNAQYMTAPLYIASLVPRAWDLRSANQQIGTAATREAIYSGAVMYCALVIFVLLLKALSNWRAWVLIPGYITLSGAGAISYFI
jgi:hypothetical protein